MRLRFLGVELGEDVARAAERLDRRRHATVDRNLQEHFPDLLTRQSVVERAPYVHLQLGDPVESRKHAEVQDAARLPRQAFARPNGAPTVLGEQLLERQAEFVGRLEGALDVLRTENLLSYAETLIAQFLVHGSSAKVNARAARRDEAA